ncbi:DUF1127 domain-containing protein [Ostreiculturibacter nitratireducens]|uniref:DUF1127 domain-containing protein n=1 Tax=Ostreiculturibacter nitratireducens TaxID=3075226 RepID=UPI0031B64470
MAYVNSAAPAAAGVRYQIQNLLEALSVRRRQYAVYRTTRAELEAMTDRDLSDIGLSRYDIEAVAREAAYGK